MSIRASYGLAGTQRESSPYAAGSATSLKLTDQVSHSSLEGNELREWKEAKMLVSLYLNIGQEIFRLLNLQQKLQNYPASLVSLFSIFFIVALYCLDA